MLVRCLYASRFTTPLPGTHLDQILMQSRRNNPRRGITGLLCFTRDLFVQVIEGGRDEVSELFATIVRDERHHEIRLLTYEEISERKFGSWTMGQVNFETLNPALLLKYSERPELNPYGCSGHATMALLMEVVATGSIVNRAAP